MVKGGAIKSTIDVKDQVYSPDLFDEGKGEGCDVTECVLKSQALKLMALENVKLEIRVFNIESNVTDY